MNKEIFKTAEPIVAMQKLGGYYKWSWKFPFRHFVEERFFVATQNGCIYEISNKKK